MSSSINPAGTSKLGREGGSVQEEQRYQPCQYNLAERAGAV